MQQVTVGFPHSRIRWALLMCIIDELLMGQLQIVSQLIFTGIQIQLSPMMTLEGCTVSYKSRTTTDRSPIIKIIID